MFYKLGPKVRNLLSFTATRRKYEIYDRRRYKLELEHIPYRPNTSIIIRIRITKQHRKKRLTYNSHVDVYVCETWSIRVKEDT